MYLHPQRQWISPLRPSSERRAESVAPDAVGLGSSRLEIAIGPVAHDAAAVELDHAIDAGERLQVVGDRDDKLTRGNFAVRSSIGPLPIGRLRLDGHPLDAKWRSGNGQAD
jgi:hypothetical protein